MQSIDLSLALKATEGDLDLLQGVIEAFLEEYPVLLVELESALRRRDSAVVQRASHTIKGSLRLFGDVPPKALAERLEEMGASGALENAMETFAQLQRTLTSLRPQLLEATKNLSDGSS